MSNLAGQYKEAYSPKMTNTIYWIGRAFTLRGAGDPARGTSLGKDASMIKDNPIPVKVAAYRKLKVQSDAVKSEMDTVKAELYALVAEAEGSKWQDGRGYAKIVTRRSSISFDDKTVNNLAAIWAQSNDPVMESCGKMLLNLRRTKDGYTYLQVK